MKNKYEISERLRIEEEPSSREETIQVRLNSQEMLPNYEDRQHSEKLRIVQQLFATGPDRWSQLIRHWPGQEVRRLTSRFGVQLLKNNSVLVGHRTNGMIHGYGLLINGPQTFYEGNFQNNVKHGYGYEAFHKGAYVGHYINGKPEGKGTFYSTTGEIYEGQYVAGIKHGYGRWSTPTQSYQGQWRANKPEGTGIIQNDISTYEGEIRAGMKHGYGREQFKNGDHYAGNYINGRPEGFGQYHWQNGTSFRGNFKNGLRHGQGVWMSSNGQRYEGDYQNDKKSGQGCFHWTNGDTYKGDYFNDLKHGYGEMKWTDGSWYKGYWRYGVQNGRGELCQLGGPIRQGLFEDNVLIEENIELKKYKMERSYVPKKDTMRKTQASTDRKLPKIGLETSRRHTTSLVGRVPKGLQYSIVRRNAQTHAISKSLHNTASKKRAKSLRSNKPPPNHRSPGDNEIFDIIQWSNIYTFQRASPLRTGM